MKKLSFKIQGLDCLEEVSALRREISPSIVREDLVSFDILRGEMTVQVSNRSTAEAEILSAIRKAGMTARVFGGKEQESTPSLWGKKGRLILVAASGLFMGLGLLSHWIIHGNFFEAFAGGGEAGVRAFPVFSAILYSVSAVLGAWLVVPKALVAAKKIRPDMNLLMCVAVFGAIGIGEWFEASAVSFLFSFSLLLESWSVSRARRAIETLLEKDPVKVRLKNNGGLESEVPPDQVPMDSLFIVRPGEKIPLDGKVAEGTSQVNQAPITGESTLVLKEVGDDVFAGTLNGNGALAVKSTKLYFDTTISRIIRMVTEAQSKRSSSEQWVEKFAKIYTPVVMVLAAVTFLVTPLLGASWHESLYRSLVMLVIACPCALVISTPVSIVAALAASAKNGVLVKGGVFMEIPAKLRAFAFDKTGTLTRGEPEVVEVVPLSGHDERELLEIAASMEAQSDHPLARTIVSCATNKGFLILPSDGLQVIQGKGVSAKFGGKTFWIGSHRYLEERGQETEEVHQMLEKLSKDGKTVMVVGNETHVCGYIAVSDRLREDGSQVIRELRKEGIQHIAILTGDNQGTAGAIAKQAGVDEFYAELLPEEKVSRVEELVKKYGILAMVGDGINDAPAMARASLGIAMGAAGSDVAIETADIALMSDDLLKIPWLVRHSRKTLSIIRQNIVFSLSVKALFVVLTLVGHASLWAAITADMGASLLVIVNSLRLLKG